MKHDVYQFILSLKEHYYVFISFLSGFIYVLWKGIKKWKDALGTIAVAVILGTITFKGIEGVQDAFGEPDTWYLAVMYNAKGSIVALVGLLSELIYNGIVSFMTSLPKLVLSKFKQRL